MQKQLAKIPSAQARLNLPVTVEICSLIFPEEEAVMLVEGDILAMTPVLPGTRKRLYGRTELILL